LVTLLLFDKKKHFSDTIRNMDMHIGSSQALSNNNNDANFLPFDKKKHFSDTIRNMDMDIDIGSSFI
jgi:hypothetical protein